MTEALMRRAIAVLAVVLTLVGIVCMGPVTTQPEPAAAETWIGQPVPPVGEVE